MRSTRSLAAVSALAIWSLAIPARAQDATAAKALFDKGLSSMQAERYREGCPSIEESYKLDPRPGTLFTLAECENKRGRLATAVARYDEYLAMYARMTEQQRDKQGDREQLVRDQKLALRAQVPELILLLPPDAPMGTVVNRDGVALAATEIGRSISIDAGEYLVTTQAPDRVVTELRVELGNGDKKRITLAVDNVTPSPKPTLVPVPTSQIPRATTVAQGISRRRAGAYGALGVGITGLVLGGVMGGLTLAKKSEIDKNCNFPTDPKGCNDAGIAGIDSAKTLALVSTVGFGIGAAGVVAGVVLLITEPKRAVGAPRSLRAGVLSAGRDGATVGIKGAW